MGRVVRRGGREHLWSRRSDLKCSSRRIINVPMDSCTENGTDLDRCIQSESTCGSYQNDDIFSKHKFGLLSFSEQQGLSFNGGNLMVLHASGVHYINTMC
jgi:hypothetical protein